MMKNNDAMREQILCLLYDHLRNDYSFDWSRQLFLGSGFSSQDLESIPPFRRDAKLEKLRRALDQLDRGSFGICIRCRGEIDDAVLSSDPLQRLCAGCERELAGGTVHLERDLVLQPLEGKMGLL